MATVVMQMCYIVLGRAMLYVFRWKGCRNRDCTIGIIAGLEAGQLSSCGWIMSRGKGLFSFTKHAGHLWDIPGLLFSGYHRGLLHWS